MSNNLLGGGGAFLNESEIFENVGCFLSVIFGVPTCSHSGNALFPGSLDDMNSQLLQQTAGDLSFQGIQC